MLTSAEATKNSLLAALASADLRRWLPQLERVEMLLGQILYEPGDVQSHVYFPTTAIASLLSETRSTTSSVCAVVGNEGVVGVALFMGGDSTVGRAVVHSAGDGLRLPAQTMKDELNRGGPVLHLMLRYAQALMAQMAQTAVCNRHHLLDQQLCRWLLLNTAHPSDATLALLPAMLAIVRRCGSVVASAGARTRRADKHTGRAR
jgi:hypothetical protein